MHLNNALNKNFSIIERIANAFKEEEVDVVNMPIYLWPKLGLVEPELEFELTVTQPLWEAHDIAFFVPKSRTQKDDFGTLKMLSGNSQNILLTSLLLYGLLHFFIARQKWFLLDRKYLFRNRCRAPNFADSLFHFWQLTFSQIRSMCSLILIKIFNIIKTFIKTFIKKDFCDK